METKHTQGPWMASPSDTSGGLAIWADNGMLGCGQISVMTNEFGPQRANAELMAAAPDLLRALSQLELAVTDIRGIDMEVYCGSELAQARAAIAKATNAPPA